MVWSRLGAALVAVCVLAHLAMAQAAAAMQDSLVTAVAAIMAAACLPCAVHLWRGPGPGVWRMAAAMSVVMLALHARHAHGSALVAISGTAAAALLLVIAGAGMATAPRSREGGTPWAYDGSSH